MGQAQFIFSFLFSYTACGEVYSRSFYE